MSKPTASFSGNDFASIVPGLIVVGHNPYNFPKRSLNIEKVANTDRSVMPGSTYDDGKVNVQVEIGQNTRELLDVAIDTLKGILQDEEAALLVNYGSGTRLWYATLSNIGFSDVKGGHATLDIEFETADPIGRDPNIATLFSNTVTNNTTGASFTVAGTAKYQLPIITITYSALTGGTNKSVTIGNSVTGQTATVTRTFTAGDVLVFNSLTGKVTANGSEIAFTGALPQFGVGPGTMTYTDTLTTRTRQTVGTYYKRYA